MRQILFLIFFSTVLLANSSEIDFWPRTFHFVLTALVLYFATRKMFVDFFGGRRNAIAASFEDVQQKLSEANRKRDAVKKQLEDAKVLAIEIREDSRSEAKNIANRISEQSRASVEILQRQEKEIKRVAKNKMIREAIQEELGLIFQDDDLRLDSGTIMKTLVKGVL